jgi:acyl-ACP thioesterase
MENVFEKEFRIRSSELDLGRKLRFTALLDYLQDAAGSHARQLGVAVTDLLPRNLTWVIARYHVQLMGMVGKREPVKVRTWPATREGLFSCREFEVLTGDTLLALATSSWAAVDLTTRRPVKIAGHLPDYPLLPLRVIADDFPPLPQLEQADLELPFRVRRADLDLNRHVNNVVYAEWALETVPETVADSCRLAEIEIAYRAEALYGDTVLARCARVDSAPCATFMHQLVNRADGRELTRLVTRWQPDTGD